jgi:hypothetical protein
LKIVAIDATDPENPRFTLRFHDGEPRQIEAAYKELVGYRDTEATPDDEAKKPLPAVPRLQHSYAITGHSSQGATYDRVIDLTIRGHGREAALVATTRHKEDHFKVIETSRLADTAEGRKGATLSLTKGAKIAKASEEDDEDKADVIDAEAIKKAWIAECCGRAPFGNVSDFHKDIHAFAGVEKPAPTRAEGVPAPMPHAIVQARAEGILKAEAAMSSRRKTWKPELAADHKPPPAVAPPPILTTAPPKKDAETRAASEKRRGQIIHWFDALKDNGVSRWLVAKRGIAAEVIKRFSDSIRAETEREFQKNGQPTTNRYGVAFAHKDGDLKLTTLARRGPLGFSRYAEGGERALFQTGNLKAPARAYISETSIDTLSIYQIDGEPEKAALLATDGSLSDAAREIIVRRAREWPETVWHVAQDNDEPKADPKTGEIFAHGHRDAVIAAIHEGNASANIVARDPNDHDAGHAYKDWNDRLRGPEYSKEAKAEAALKEHREQEFAKAERRRQAEEQAALDVPTYRPKLR